jgi:hypothetical protein
MEYGHQRLKNTTFTIIPISHTYFTKTTTTNQQTTIHFFVMCRTPVRLAVAIGVGYSGDFNM